MRAIKDQESTLSSVIWMKSLDVAAGPWLKSEEKSTTAQHLFVINESMLNVISHLEERCRNQVTICVLPATTWILLLERELKLLASENELLVFLHYKCFYK